MQIVLIFYLISIYCASHTTAAFPVNATEISEQKKNEAKWMEYLLFCMRV